MRLLVNIKSEAMTLVALTVVCWSPGSTGVGYGSGPRPGPFGLHCVVKPVRNTVPPETFSFCFCWAQIYFRLLQTVKKYECFTSWNASASALPGKWELPSREALPSNGSSSVHFNSQLQVQFRPPASVNSQSSLKASEAVAGRDLHDWLIRLICLFLLLTPICAASNSIVG